MGLLDKILARTGFSATKKKVVANLYWAVLGKVVTLLGGLLVGILVARYLGPDQYGLMNYVISYVALFQIFASFGMDNIEIRELSKETVDRNVILGTAFRIKLILALITVILVIGTALIFETDRFTASMISLYSLSVILNRFTVIRNYFTSVVWNEYIVKTEIMRTLVGAGVKVLLLLVKAPLWTFIAATVFDVFLVSTGYVLAYKTKIGPMSLWQFDWKVGKYLLKQSFPLLLFSAASVLYQRIDQVMIGNMIDKASVAQFSVAAKFVEIATFASVVMAQTIVPVLVRIREQSEKKYEEQSQKYMSYMTWFYVFGTLFIYFVSPWVVLYTFGGQYMEAVPILQLLIFKSIGLAVGGIGGQLIIIEKIQKYAFVKTLLASVLCVLLNCMLIPVWGVMGSALVAVITVFFSSWLGNAFIPAYRHIFIKQTRALFFGWKDVFQCVGSNMVTIFKKKRKY